MAGLRSGTSVVDERSPGSAAPNWGNHRQHSVVVHIGQSGYVNRRLVVLAIQCRRSRAAVGGAQVR